MEFSKWNIFHPASLPVTNPHHSVAVSVNSVGHAPTGQVLGRHVDRRSDDDVSRRRRLRRDRRTGSRNAVITHLRSQLFIEQNIGTVDAQKRTLR